MNFTKQETSEIRELTPHLGGKPATLIPLRLLQESNSSFSFITNYPTWKKEVTSHHVLKPSPRLEVQMAKRTHLNDEAKCLRS